MSIKKIKYSAAGSLSSSESSPCPVTSCLVCLHTAACGLRSQVPNMLMHPLYLSLQLAGQMFHLYTIQHYCGHHFLSSVYLARQELVLHHDTFISFFGPGSWVSRQYSGSSSSCSRNQFCKNPKAFLTTWLPYAVRYTSCTVYCSGA